MPLPANTSPFLLLQTVATPCLYLSHSTPQNPRQSLLIPLPFYSSNPMPVPAYSSPFLLLQTHVSPPSTSLLLHCFVYPVYICSIGRNRLYYIVYNCVRLPYSSLDLLLLSFSYMQLSLFRHFVPTEYLRYQRHVMLKMCCLDTSPRLFASGYLFLFLSYKTVNNHP